MHDRLNGHHCQYLSFHAHAWPLLWLLRISLCVLWQAPFAALLYLQAARRPQAPKGNLSAAPHSWRNLKGPERQASTHNGLVEMHGSNVTSAYVAECKNTALLLCSGLGNEDGRQDTSLTELGA